MERIPLKTLALNRGFFSRYRVIYLHTAAEYYKENTDGNSYPQRLRMEYRAS
tara:strand:+ start:555 stop:710 length:156 start_codon:yes stop_codon:yes gene_type:complete